jgi:hypothetical protein
VKSWTVRGVFLAVFLLGTLVLHVSFYPPARAQSFALTGPIFKDSFESGTELTSDSPPGAWDGNYSSDGTPGGNNTVQSSIVYGANSYAANFTATAAWQYGCVYKNLSSYMALESSTMVYLSRIPLEAVLGTTLCYDYSWGTFFAKLKTIGGNGYWGIQVFNDSGFFTFLESTPSNPSANSWYNITLYGQGGVNAAAYLWVNGILKVSVSGVIVTARAPLSCARDEFWLDVSESSPISCYSDNITVYAASPGPPTPGVTETLGYTTLGSTTASAAPNTMCGYHAAPSHSGAVNNISAYVYAQSGTVDLAGALYDYSTGACIGQTQEITVDTTPEWKTMSFFTPPNVTAGTQYWIVWWQNASTYYACDTDGPSGIGFDTYSLPGFPVFPSALPVITSESDQRSVYATYSYFLSLTVGVSGHGVTNATGTGNQYQNSNVTVLATPNPGSVFSRWLLDGADAGSANPYTVNMTGNWSLVAVFSSAAYLSLSVDPSLATYTGGQMVSLDVTVINEAGSYVNSTLTLTVTGPGGYGYFDFDRIRAGAGLSEYGFDWTVPGAGGTYVVEVSLVPAQLTAYDAAWLEVVSG